MFRKTDVGRGLELSQGGVKGFKRVANVLKELLPGLQQPPLTVRIMLWAFFRISGQGPEVWGLLAPYNLDAEALKLETCIQTHEPYALSPVLRLRIISLGS